jgi:hypothetical protein
VQFWNAMAAVSEHELAEAQRQEDIDRARLRGEDLSSFATRRGTGWHSAIEADVSAMFAGEMHSQGV